MTYKIIPLPNNATNLSGKFFGRALAIAPIQRRSVKGVTWLCACHCGNVFLRTTSHLNSSKNPSCGCLDTKLSHGMTDSTEYRIWTGMLTRCTNKNEPQYANYGGRGITICKSWTESFLNFYRDMGERPEGTSLDRIDNNGPYCASNCRWATRKEQAENRRTRYKNSELITCCGQTMTITEWSRHTGIGRCTIRARIKKGWVMERALHEEVIHRARWESCRP